jgi:2-keto-4-pentenoate hydratase/2-oxohepta-3-ene-1,7-dioic acid hydratase in catechol pathway
MKFATFEYEGRCLVGVIDPDRGAVWPLAAGVDGMLDLIRRYDELKPEIMLGGEGIAVSKIVLDAPIPRPFRNILCVGKNYLEHAREFARSGFDTSAKSDSDAIPKAPIIFTKVPESVIGDGAPICYPYGVSEQVDYEAELAVVIGARGRGIERADAYSHVWGYTIINDITARDLQSTHKQWFLGKSIDTFCPMGPWAVTADDVEPDNLTVRCWVNDELRQNANTRDLIFDIPTLIEAISAGMTLYPGDIISTGTPMGVGVGFNPPRFLRPGDRVTIEIEGIGKLSNPVV